VLISHNRLTVICFDSPTVDMSRPADHNTVERNLEAREPHIVSVIGATDNADWERKAGDRQIAHMNIRRKHVHQCYTLALCPCQVSSCVHIRYYSGSFHSRTPPPLVIRLLTNFVSNRNHDPDPTSTQH